MYHFTVKCTPANRERAHIYSCGPSPKEVVHPWTRLWTGRPKNHDSNPGMGRRSSVFFRMSIPLPSAEVENKWICTSSPLYAFVVARRNNFYLSSFLLHWVYGPCRTLSSLRITFLASVLLAVFL